MNISTFTHKTENELELLLENTNSGLVMYFVSETGKLKIGLMNKGYCDLLESSEEDLIKRFEQDPLFGVCAVDKKKVLAFFQNIIEKKEDGSISFSGVTTTGKNIWATIKVKYCKMLGTEDRIYTTYFDNTDLILAQEQLETVIHNVPGAICLFKWNGTSLVPLVISESYAKMMGTNALGLFGSNYLHTYDHIHPDDLKGIRESFFEALKTTHYINCTYRNLKDDGTYIWVNVKGNIVPQEDGTFYCYMNYNDVTKNIENIHKVKESERILETATENAGVWYFIYNWTEDTALFGPRSQRDFGLNSKMENFQENFFTLDFIEESCRKDFFDALMQMTENATPIMFDARFHFKGENTFHWGRFLLTHIYDGNNITDKIIATLSIIDVLKEIQEKYEIEKKHSSIHNENLIGRGVYNLYTNEVVEYDTDKIIPNGENLTFDELGLFLAKRIPNQEQRGQYLAYHSIEGTKKLYEAGQTEFSFDYRLKLDTGKVIWVRNTIHILKDPKTMDVLIFNYCYDINRTKILEQMTQFAVNDDYDLLGCVDLQSEIATMLFGKNSYNIINSNFVEEDYNVSLIRFTKNAIVENEREEYFQKASLENVKKRLESTHSFEFYLHMMKDGEVFAKKICYTKDLNDDNLVFFTQVDVTKLMQEEKKKQDQLSVALKGANSANEAKSSFLSQMSHEIRTPLNAILGMANLIKDVNDVREKDRYVNKIDQAGHYLLGIINDILDISRIESGKFELRNDWAPIKDTIQTAISMLEMEMNVKGIKFIAPNLHDFDHIEGFIDTLRCQQVYMNIINNAIKFTPSGGIISIKVKNISRDGKIAKDRVVISDTGCGMNKGFMKKLFTPFEREENEYSKNASGTGLGLTIVKKIIDSMGGTIAVESALGEGTTFSIEIYYEYRVVEETVDLKTENVTVDDILVGKRILLVDDHPLNREIVLHLLTKKGSIVLEATNGKEAVELFKNHQADFFDCIIMDIKMPVMDGLEATRQIRSLNHPNAKSIPILAMTANAFDEDIKATLEAGMNAHLAKPIEPKLLLKAIAKYIRKK